MRAGRSSRSASSAPDGVRARDEFISIASHELRTPLSTLQLAIQDLARIIGASKEDPAARRLRTATRGVERLTRLVNTLLDVSRLKSGGFPLAREPLDLCRVTMDAVEQLRGAAGAAGCEVEVVAPHPVLGSWDRTAIEQVVVNLLENAVKYAPGKPVEVRVSRLDGKAIIAVRDHGVGVAPENVARIFDRFERGVTAQHSTGLGLGLYIARHLVQVHGGGIELESTPGAGSTFTVSLPWAWPTRPE